MPLTAVEDAIDMAHPRRSDMMRTTTKRTPPAMMPTTVQFVAPGVPVLAARRVFLRKRPRTAGAVFGARVARAPPRATVRWGDRLPAEIAIHTQLRVTRPRRSSRLRGEQIGRAHV